MLGLFQPGKIPWPETDNDHLRIITPLVNFAEGPAGHVKMSVLDLPSRGWNHTPRGTAGGAEAV
jgi:hypothetical protein